ncbi:MAG: NAD kinase [Wenzhouxiangellaceae bacterium]
MTTTPRIAFAASATDEAQKALAILRERYQSVALEEADVLVALGGDGFMLRTLHALPQPGLPVYGMKRGTVGFLMNRFSADDLIERVQQAQQVELNPLRMHVATESGQTVTGLAINEVSLLRQTNQAAHIRVLVNDVERVSELICDGILLASAAGSTAYNLSAHGPILPLGTEAMAMTPISPFRPRRWRGAILPSSARVRFEVLDRYKRPVSATADAHEVRNVTAVDITLASDVSHHLLFDPDHSLEERIIAEQFM